MFFLLTPKICHHSLLLPRRFLHEDIDSVVGETKVGFIKMDIEGCEYEGLQGAAATIKTWRLCKALLALEIACITIIKNSGMQASVNFLVGLYNIYSGEVEEIAEFCQKHDYHFSLVLAAPTGNWKSFYKCPNILF